MHNMSSFRGFRKIILGVIRILKFWSCTEFWKIIRVIDISGWLSSLKFLSVTLEIKPRLFYWVVKNLGRPWSLSHIHVLLLLQVNKRKLPDYKSFKLITTDIHFVWHFKLISITTKLWNETKLIDNIMIFGIFLQMIYLEHY